MRVDDDHSWTARATCATDAPDALFVRGAAQRAARAVCLACPVRMECLADALDSQSAFGVWGGLTERERRALLKRYPDVTDWRAWLEDEADEVAAELRAELLGHRTPRLLARFRAS